MTTFNSWEMSYQTLVNQWGLESEHMINQYEDLVPMGKVLDLGIGEGRNIINFAAKNYTIEGVDVSRSALERCESILNSTTCSYQMHCGRIEEFDIMPNSYNMIISSWSLNFLKKSVAMEVINKAIDGLAKEGIIYIGVFSTEDPQLLNYKKTLKEVEPNTFYIEERDTYKTYFTKEELLSLVSEDVELVSVKQDYSLDNGHGEPHYHGAVELVLRKK